MLRSRLYRYKLSEFSYLTGIDTYRLKKLDQQGILPARTINGRRYYDETAVMLAAFHSDNEFAKPTIHNIVIAIGKLLTLIKIYNKNNKKTKCDQTKTQFQLLYEDVLRESLDENTLDEIDLTVIFDNVINYMEQVRNAVNVKDKQHKIEDEELPCIVTLTKS